MGRKIYYGESIIQLGGIITMIALVWIISFPLYQDKGIIANLFFTLVFGIGGIAFYLPIAYQIRKVFDWIYKIEGKNDK